MDQEKKQNIVKDEQELEKWLRNELAAILKVAPDTLDRRKHFVQYGLGSLQATALITRLAEQSGRSLSISLPWDYPTIEALSQHLAHADRLADVTPTNIPSAEAENEELEPIAIIGLNCRFPGASDTNTFWKLLCAGEDAITHAPPTVGMAPLSARLLVCLASKVVLVGEDI